MNTKILLVDDEERILQTFARTLRLGGYTVITAEDGEQGLVFYHQQQPDIVLLDLRMPGTGGLEVLQAIRADDPEANVILCTAHGDKEAVIEAMRAGASDFLPKPIDQVMLESALRRAEERIHLKRELQASQEALRRHNERLEEEVKARTVELEREIEERKSVQEELRQTLVQLEGIKRYSPDLITVMDRDGRYLMVNQAVAQFLGRESEEIVGRTFGDILPPRVADLFTKRVETVFETEAPLEVEDEALYANGESVYETVLFPLFDQDGCCYAVGGIARDITERKQVETKLQERVKELACLYALSRDMQEDLSVDELCWRAVDHLTQAMQFPEHTVVMIELDGNRYASERYTSGLSPCLRAKIRLKGDVRGQVKACYTEEHPFLIPEEQDLVNGVAEALSTWLERKRVEDALQASERRFRTLFDAFPLGITIADREGKILEANRISERLLGISLEEHAARDIDGEEWHIIRPDGSPMPAAEYASVRALQEDRMVRNVEMGIVKPDADITWINVTAAPLMDDRVVVTYNDVTDRRRAEEDLQQASAKLIEDLHWLSQTALHLLSLSDGSEILDYAARALQEKLGDCFVWPLTRTSDGQALRLGSLPGIDSSLLGKAIQLIGFDPRKRTFAIVPEFREIYQQGQLFRHEGGLTGFAASEVPRPVGEALAKLLGVHDVYTIGLVGRERVLGNLHIAARRPELIEAPELVESFAHQVALALEQATANEALEESEERYRAVSELVSDYAYAFRVESDGRLIGEWVTEAFCRITGYTPEELPVGESWNRLFHPEDRPAIERHIGKLLEGQSHDLAYRIITRDGDERWVHTYDRPEWDEREHRVTRIYGAVQDVTDRKRAEEGLQESYEQLSLLFDILPVGVSVLDQERRVVEQNRALRRIVALSEDELLEGEYRNRRYLRADGSPMPAEEFPSSRILSGESEVQCAEVGVVKEDGELIWTDVRAVGCSIGDWRVVIVTTDVTERRQTQQALERVRYSIDRVTDSVLWVDENGRFIDVNDAACRNLGYEREELLEIGVADIDPHYPAEVWDAHWAEMVECGTMIVESVHETKAGERFPVEVVIHNQRFGETWYNCVLARDITKRKRAQEALRESEERFRTLVNVLPQFVSYTDRDSIYRFVNQTYQEKFEVARDEIIGRSVRDVIGEAAFEEARPHIKRVLAGERVRYHERFDYAIGGTRDIDGILVPDVAEEGHVRGYYAVLTDITPYMEVQEALHQTTERLRILHEIDAAILAARSSEEIGRAALMRLYDLIPCQITSIAEIDPIRQRGRDLIVLIDGERAAGDSGWHPFSSAAHLIDTIQGGDVYHVEDIAALETKLLLEERLEAAGVRSYISVPLLVQGIPHGTLNLASDAPGSFQPDHVEILEEVADSLAVALQQAHLLEQAQEDAETKALLLREVNHRVLNNLTMILGILDMERIRPLESEDDFHATLDDVTRRVDGMVTVHRMLSSAQWTPLDLREVAVKVIQAALKGLPDRQTVDFTVEASGPPHRVTPRQGIEVAVILNELTTNSVKYAFDERSAGRITVRIVTADEGDEERKVEVVFRDNGPGFPEAVLSGEREGIGLWLAASKATRDLGGEIDLWNDDGAVVSLTFTPAAGSDRSVVDDDR